MYNVELVEIHIVYIIESFWSPFALNGNGEKRHEVSRHTLNGERLGWIFNVSYAQKQVLLYEISVELFCSPADSIQRYMILHVLFDSLTICKRSFSEFMQFLCQARPSR